LLKQKECTCRGNERRGKSVCLTIKGVISMQLEEPKARMADAGRQSHPHERSTSLKTAPRHVSNWRHENFGIFFDRRLRVEQARNPVRQKNDPTSALPDKKSQPRRDKQNKKNGVKEKDLGKEPKKRSIGASAHKIPVR